MRTLNTQYESQGAGDEYLRKAKLNTEFAGFLTELQMTAAAPIQQTEQNGIKLAAACIKEGMWLESHYVAALLHRSCHSSLLRNLTTESIFGDKRSSLPSRLDVHKDNVKIHRDSPTSIKYESALA